MTHGVRTIADGLVFPECPRWHDGRLWLSDMGAEQVLRVDVESGAVETVVKVPGSPAGLGWDREGRMLVVGMSQRALLRYEGGELTRVADLAPVSKSRANDMVVDAAGRAFVTNVGFSLVHEAPRPTRMARVDPDGSVTILEPEVVCPNGVVVSADGARLFVAETYANRISELELDPDGNPVRRSVFAEFGPDVRPDGICLDAEEAIWISVMDSPVVLRVRRGGDVVDEVEMSQPSFACMLGGADRRTLFACTSPGNAPEQLAARGGRIEAAEVTVPGAGLP